ncbi:MBL fold metallo-hydrolase [Candidatus Woesearchaeota archaeon]|nr:MBL fold metallo-hydrolase [Candidatus Woesearchaeota archaeon]
MIKKITDNIWKITRNSSIYLIKNKEWIAIDAGDRKYHRDIIRDMIEIVDPEKIKKVLFTHLHCDHIGNIDLFPNAEFYASREEIDSLKNNAADTVLSEDIIKKSRIKLKPLPKKIENLEVIETPGHTKGGVCFYLRKEKILFSGDTLFSMTHCGRTDLPTSVPEKLKQTLDKLYKLKINTLCPGHDYDL